MATIKAVISLFEVILFAIGIIPLNTDINYGGNKYLAPEITTPMYIAENGGTDFVIITEENPDECMLTAVSEMQKYIVFSFILGKCNCLFIAYRSHKIGITYP